MGGFTYNGVHCSTYGVDYAPDASARWWEGAEFETYKKDVAWRHGGYWYGNSVNIREIKLSCYFEEIDIATREKIRKWLGRTTSGKLIFDDTPFVYYNVRPDSVVPGQLYLDTNESYSGTFVVTFMATDPFGYLTRKYNTGSENDGAENYCGIITSGKMPAAPTTSTRTFYVYNPGTENCGMIIKVSGTASKPIRFFNQRNGTMCVINTLPSSGLILDLNGDTGMVKVYTSGSSSFSNGFAYHDYGMVRLNPDDEYTSIDYTAQENGTMYDITVSGIAVTEEMVGAYIQFNNPSTRSARVNSVNTNTNKLTCTLGGSGTFQTSGKILRLQTLNPIVIQEKNNNGVWVTPTGLTLTSIEIDYNPRLL